MIGHGNRLSYYRKIQNKKAEEVACEARMSLRFYRAIERGDMIPGSQYVGLLEKSLNTPFRLLFPQFFSESFLNPINGPVDSASKSLKEKI